jgi:Cu/Ag efflux pump CusA
VAWRAWRAPSSTATALPQLQIEIDRDRAARYGLNVRDIDEVIETALGGRQVGELWEGDRRFPITLRLDDADRDLQRCARCRSASAMATR